MPVHRGAAPTLQGCGVSMAWARGALRHHFEVHGGMSRCNFLRAETTPVGNTPQRGLRPHFGAGRVYICGISSRLCVLELEEDGSWGRKAESGPGCWEPCWSSSAWSPSSPVLQGSGAGHGAEQPPGLVCLCSCICHPHRNNFSTPTWHPCFKVDSRKMSTVHKPKQNHLLWQLWLRHLEHWTQPAPHFCQRLRDNCQASRLSISGKERCPQDSSSGAACCSPPTFGRKWLRVGFPVGAVLRRSSQLASSPVAKCLIWCPWQPDVWVLINSSWPMVRCYAGVGRESRTSLKSNHAQARINSRNYWDFSNGNEAWDSHFGSGDLIIWSHCSGADSLCKWVEIIF